LRAFITGIGWLTAGGEGRGRNGDPFKITQGYLSALAKKPAFTNQAFRRFGRLDRFSKLGLRAVASAMQDAGLDTWKDKRNIGVIVSTTLGSLATDLDYYGTVMSKDGTLSDPNLFTYTLPNSFLGHVSMIFGLTGINYVINDKEGSGIPALTSAMDCLSLGECDTILAGICDVEPPPDFPVSVKPLPGAVFTVIEKNIGRQVQPYGNLLMNNSGSLFFNGSVITNISALVKECLRT